MRWRGVLVRENTPTTDGRLIQPHVVTWDEQRPLRLRSPDGRRWWDIEKVWRDGLDVWGEGYGPHQPWRPTVDLGAVTIETPGAGGILIITSGALIGAVASDPAAQVWPDLPFQVTE